MPAARNPILFLGLTRIDNGQIKTYRKRTCQCGNPISMYNPNKYCYACMESGKSEPAWEVSMKAAQKRQKRYTKKKRKKK